MVKDSCTTLHPTGNDVSTKQKLHISTKCLLNNISIELAFKVSLSSKPSLILPGTFNYLLVNDFQFVPITLKIY
jgi:hypothetical protein